MSGKSLLDIVQRVQNPEPWSEGEKIPWDDPGFSERMLRHHLSQEHDLASRRFEIIDRHVEWIHNILGGKPSRILDLACGPGFYAHRLARLGHICRGVDFGPASIRYARERASEDGLTIEYALGDIRTADYGAGNDLVMLIYGELNVFRREDVRRVLGRAYDSLREGGVFIAEPSRYEAVRREGTGPATWYSSEGGLFSPGPHLCLMENFWDPDAGIATTRYYVVDTETGGVALHASSSVAYRREELELLLRGAGFRDVEFHESLSGGTRDLDENLEVVAARK
jgi:SAM-dependent methyltransferase